MEPNDGKMVVFQQFPNDIIYKATTGLCVVIWCGLGSDSPSGLGRAWACRVSAGEVFLWEGEESQDQDSTALSTEGMAGAAPNPSPPSPSAGEIQREREVQSRLTSEQTFVLQR